MDYVVTNESSSGFQVTNVEIVDKTLPVYHYCGHLYYLGFHILLIFQRPSLAFNHLFQVDEIVPFVESCLAPGVFNPIISQMHWKKDNKLVDVAQNAEYPFYCIHRVDMEEGVVITHLILTQEDR